MQLLLSLKYLIDIVREFKLYRDPIAIFIGIIYAFGS